MLRLLLDTEALAVPTDPTSQGEMERYAMTLVMLTELLDDPSVRLVRSGEAWTVLETEGRRPPWGPSNVDDYLGSGDASTLFVGIMERSETIEALTGLDDVLLESVVVEPDAHLSDRSEGLRQDYERALGLWWVVPAANPSARSAPMLSVGLSEPVPIAFAADALLVEPESAVFDELPVAIAGSAIHFEACTDLCKAVSPTSLLLDGSLELACIFEDLHRRGAYEISDALKASWEINLHPEFLEMAAEKGFLREEVKARRLLRACVDVLTGVRMGQCHHLRTGPSGAAPVVKRADGAEAWRKDIDHEYHLHYWKRGDAVEFAAVVTHNDFSIPH